MRLVNCLVYVFMLLLLVLTACKKHDKIYTSDCNDGHDFVPVHLKSLADSPEFYNHKFVEITGKFQQDKSTSLLLGDKKGQYIMVEFSNECPLFLTGTRIGFFDYDNNDGQLTPANNKTVKLRGEVILHPKSNANKLRLSVVRISYVQF